MQWAVYLSTQNRRSICLSVVCSRKKQAGWSRKCLCKYSTEVSRFVLEILEKSKVIALLWPPIFPQKPQVWKPLENPKAKKENPYVARLLITFLNSTPFSNSLQKIPHAITFTCNQFHVFKPIAWVFILEYSDLEGCLGYNE